MKAYSVRDRAVIIPFLTGFGIGIGTIECQKTPQFRIRIRIRIRIQHYITAGFGIGIGIKECQKTPQFRIRIRIQHWNYNSSSPRTTLAVFCIKELREKRNILAFSENPFSFYFGFFRIESSIHP